MKRFANLHVVDMSDGNYWVNEKDNLDLLTFMVILTFGTILLLYFVYITTKYAEIAEDWDKYMDNHAYLEQKGEKTSVGSMVLEGMNSLRKELNDLPRH
jgi:hypothetical protein